MSKLILLISPMILASMLFLANPAQAAIATPAPTTFTTSTSIQPTHQNIIPTASQSNPIIDNLGCTCSACIQSQLQGKLPLN